MMRSMMSRPGASLAGLALMGVLSAGSVASGQGWGTVKGQVVYGGDKLPDNPEVTVTNDKAYCTKDGKILRNEWVVDPKTKGVKWALVWLTEEGNADAKKLDW